MALKPIGVSQLNDYLSRVIGSDPIMSNVLIKGEASGVKYHYTGHVYFSLVDGASKLNCFLHKDSLSELNSAISDGMQLVCSGRITVYKAGGSYSLYVKSVEIAGEGDLAAAFVRMRDRLMEEGLFDPAHKKKLPVFPRNIGVVTASTGAAVKDIIKTLKSRNDVCGIKIFPCRVQGNGAAEEIADRIRFANEKHRELEILIVGRGGGSAEDLWPFNEEIVARAVYESEIPVISAVGHETDFSISDMAADVRAATPTAAAQIAVPDTGELAENIAHTASAMKRQIENTFMFNKMKAENCISQVGNLLEKKVIQSKNSLEHCRLLLEENHPFRVLEKGYSVVETETGRVISDSSDLIPGADYRIIFKRGKGVFRFIRQESGNTVSERRENATKGCTDEKKHVDKL